MERLKIQYGTSYCYPVSSMGAHVSAVPNHQLHRVTPLHTRANVAFFGAFGYELDLNRLSQEELAQIRQQTAFMKQWRGLLQFGTFYRLESPFEGNTAAWMTVREDQAKAIVGWYRVLNTVTPPYTRLRLTGLDPDRLYTVTVREKNRAGRVVGQFYGDELMHAGLVTSDQSSGESLEGGEASCDFDSRLYILE